MGIDVCLTTAVGTLNEISHKCVGALLFALVFFLFFFQNNVLRLHEYSTT